MTDTACKSQCELETPKRNRYYFGQLLDVAHFTGSDQYFNRKRWLLNRLVSGYGVVCGLNVRAGSNGKSVIIDPGVAIDKWGREIVVPEETAPFPIPPHLLVSVEEPRGASESGEEEKRREQADGKSEGKGRDKGEDEGEGEGEGEDEGEGEGEGEGRIQLHALLCYHECETEPEPVYAGACKEESTCQPGSIEERYKVIIRRGRLRRPAPRLNITKAIAEGAKPRLDHAALARWVSRRCPECPRDPCIPLANLRIRANGDDTRWKTDVDISVRPICYSNDLLFQLILGLLAEQPDQRTSE